jgi:hypothetical protein
VREPEPVVPELDVAEEEHVHVDRPRAVAGPAERPAELGLDDLAGVEQLERLELGADARRGVQEVRLVEDLADRLRLIQGRDGLDRDRVLREQLERPFEVPLAVADVRAEAEVADAPGQG